MDRDNVAALAARLESIPDEQFNMGMYWLAETSCGCLVGHAATLIEGGIMDTSFSREEAERPIVVQAREWLGLDDWQARTLFYAYTAENILKDITRQQAIETLQRLLETGEVRWA